MLWILELGSQGYVEPGWSNRLVQTTRSAKLATWRSALARWRSAQPWIFCARILISRTATHFKPSRQSLPSKGVLSGCQRGAWRKSIGHFVRQRYIRPTIKYIQTPAQTVAQSHLLLTKSPIYAIIERYSVLMPPRLILRQNINPERRQRDCCCAVFVHCDAG